MSRQHGFGWLAALAAGGVMTVFSHGCSTLGCSTLGCSTLGCSTLADDCLDGRCWETEGQATGGSGASTSSGGGGGGGGAGLSGGGGQGGSGSAVCGNDVEEAGEECDDGNTTDADGCEGDCTLPRCGNGIVDPGEVCFTQAFVAYDLSGNDAADMAVSDCDQDGDPDLIVVDEGENTFTVLRNDGGTLTVETPWGSGLHEFIRITVAETDGTAGDELYGAGNTFVVGPAIIQYEVSDCAFSQVRVHAGSQRPTDIAAVRFAGDQLDDPVALAFVTGPQDGKLSFVSDGSVGGSCTVIDLGTPTPAGMAVAQLGSSSLLDLAYVDFGLGAAFVRLNNGSGFGGPTSISVPGGPIAVAAADIDGDGINDLAVAANTGNVISLLTNDGSGDLSNHPPVLPLNPSATVPASRPIDVRLVDIDGDGDVDVVSANFCNPALQEGSVSLFLNDGTGTFDPATSANFGAAVGEDFPIAVARHPTTVRVVDLNGDGALDLVTTNGYADGGAVSQVNVLLAQP